MVTRPRHVGCQVLGWTMRRWDRTGGTGQNRVKEGYQGDQVETNSHLYGRCQGTCVYEKKGGVLTDGDWETDIILGNYRSNRPRPLTGYTRARQRGTASSLLTIQTGTKGGGGGRLLSSSTKLPPTYKSKPNIRTGRTWRASKLHQATINATLYSGAVGVPTLGGDSSGHGDLRPGVHYVKLPPMSQSLGAGWEDRVNDQAR